MIYILIKQVLKKVGYMVIVKLTHHITDRDKRVIRRDHVKEAQSLINNYKDHKAMKISLRQLQK